jgi:putative hydrolase of the HAD superfamily
MWFGVSAGKQVRTNHAQKQVPRACAAMTYSVDALLFDLGKVVIDFDFSRAFARWASHARCEESLIRAHFSHDEDYDRHERGHIDSEVYFSALRASFGIDISDAQFRDGWNAILTGEVPGMSSLLATAAERFPLYALTNSNHEHQQYLSIRFAEVLRHLKRIFVSSTIGLRKPEAEAYEYVVERIGVPARRILFFDDLIENVEGARTYGLQAVHVMSGADVKDALAAAIG